VAIAESTEAAKDKVFDLLDVFSLWNLRKLLLYLLTVFVWRQLLIFVRLLEEGVFCSLQILLNLPLKFKKLVRDEV